MNRFLRPARLVHSVIRPNAIKTVAEPQYARILANAYHNSSINENQLIIGGLAVLGATVTLQHALKAYDTYQANKPPDAPEGTKSDKAESENTAKTADATADGQQTRERANTESKDDAKTETKKEGGGMFDSWFARNFYDGGFEDKMTKREAALILGVRESATAERVKDAHRKIMQINHPDKGGSAYLTAKVNEAKELLLKGKQ